MIVLTITIYSGQFVQLLRFCDNMNTQLMNLNFPDEGGMHPEDLVDTRNVHTLADEY